MGASSRHSRDPSEVDRLLADLQSSRRRKRLRAARALKGHHEPEARDPLLAAALGTDLLLAEAAIGALAGYPDDEVATRLSQLVHSDDEYLSLAAAASLAEMGRDDGVEVLRRAVQSPDVDQGPIAVWALAQFGESGLSEVEQVLRDPEQASRTRETAASALLRFGGEAGRVRLGRAYEEMDEFVRRAVADLVDGHN